MLGLLVALPLVGSSASYRRGGGRFGGPQGTEPARGEAITEGGLVGGGDDADDLRRGGLPREHPHPPTVERMPGEKDVGEVCQRRWWIAVRSLLVAIRPVCWRQLPAARGPETAGGGAPRHTTTRQSWSVQTSLLPLGPLSVS